MIILLIGLAFSMQGSSPIQAIMFAQITNGILLPVIAIYLLIIMNNKHLLGKFSNNRLQNIFGIVIVLIMIILGGKSILFALGVL